MEGDLEIGLRENYEAQAMLETVVTDCEGFYRAVSGHPALIPHMAVMLVDIFFSGVDSNVKTALVTALIRRNPITYRDAFLSILNSRSYLLGVRRPRYFEETFYNYAAKTGWQPTEDLFAQIPGSLGSMSQPVFEHKLGRSPEAPLDSLSLARQMEHFRERGVLDLRRDEFDESDGGWSPGFLDVELEGEEFLRYLFLSIVEREPSRDELDELQRILDDEGYSLTKNRRAVAVIALDYFSRLPEMYTYEGLF